MSAVTLQRVRETDAAKYPSNTVTDYYDIIHKMMEALVFLDGIKIKGKGAHQELIDYICKKYRFTEAIRIFIQEIREYRNRISYEGFFMNPMYITTNKEKIESIIDHLISLCNSQLLVK